MWFANIFSPSIACLFIFLPESYVEHVFNFDEVHFTSFCFRDHVFGVISKNSLPNPKSRRCSPMFSSKTFILLHRTFKPIIHFELFFCICVRFREVWFFCLLF